MLLIVFIKSICISRYADFLPNPRSFQMDTHQRRAAAHTNVNRLAQDDITGLGAIDDRMLILLDIEKLMTGSDMALVDTALH